MAMVAAWSWALLVLGLRAQVRSTADFHRKSHGTITCPKCRPYQVYLPKANCGGALIKRSWVLTTGPCVISCDPKEVDTHVAVGSAADENLKKYSIQSITLNPCKNDIALIKLREPVLTDTVNIISLGADEDLIPGAYGLVSGWEKYNPGSRLLYSSSVRICSKEQCAGDPKFDLVSMLCAYEERSDACARNEGDPLTVAGKLVGLVSIASRCCEVGGGERPIVRYYLNVPGVRAWIEKVTGETYINRAFVNT